MANDERVVSLSKSCRLIARRWEHSPTSVTLEYIEHSPDPWYSDTETEVDIEAAEARQIVALLSEVFLLGDATTREGGE